MKAISVKQPWASLIVHGIKDIENRTWQTYFRGRVYIHASAPKKFNVQLTDEQTKTSIPVLMSAIDGVMPFGAIIGEVDIVDCVINHPSIWAEKTEIQECKNCAEMKGEDVCCLYQGKRNDFIPYASKPIYNWVLANPVLYEKPILNVKGALSFWEPDFDITECIGCNGKFNENEMKLDLSGEHFCIDCANEMFPIMEKEYQELKAKGEIE